MPSLLTYWQSNYRPIQPLDHRSVTDSNLGFTCRSASNGHERLLPHLVIRAPDPKATLTLEGGYGEDAADIVSSLPRLRRTSIRCQAQESAMAPVGKHRPDRRCRPPN